MTIHEQFPIPIELAFRVSPRTMRMLGRENISSPVISVLELVKNAYDADASRVEIIFENTSSPDGYIVIADDGVGMDLQALQENWMVISTDNKVHSPLTAKGRRKVGEKGIGRLAIDRLARQAIIETYQAGQPGFRLEINWDKYEQDSGQLQDIRHPLTMIPERDNGLSGTKLYLTSLRDRWSLRDYQAVYNDLALLVPPFAQTMSEFSIYFECTDVPALSGEIKSPMAEIAEYTLSSSLSSKGEIHHIAIHRSGDKVEDKRSWSNALNLEPNSHPSSGPLRFDLYFYLRDAQSLKDTSVKLTELRQFLQRFQGIRIYRDSFRVKPYGDPGGDKDWLGLNARYARSRAGVSSEAQQWRLSEAQVIGTVFITRQDNTALQDQTNREGLIENEAYEDMRRFLLHGIQFLERERQKRSRNENKNKEKEPKVSVDVALGASEKELNVVATKLRKMAESPPLFPDWKVVADLADSVEHVVETHIQQSQVAYETQQIEIETRQTEYQMLLGLSTLGIATTAFGHEIAQAIHTVQARANLLGDGIQELPPQLSSNLSKDLMILLNSAARVDAWGKFALDRVRQDKRKQKEISINKVLTAILEELRPPLERDQICLTVQMEQNIPLIRAFVMDIEAICINFVTNAKEAMRYRPLEQRRIDINTNYLEVSHEICFTFADSGRGIRVEDIDEIWNPLFSTKKDEEDNPVGTGMGLTIVKNIVESYNGRIEVNGYGRLGGAEFSVYFPVDFDKDNANGNHRLVN